MAGMEIAPYADMGDRDFKAAFGQRFGLLLIKCTEQRRARRGIPGRDHQDFQSVTSLSAVRSGKAAGGISPTEFFIGSTKSS